MNFSRRRFLAGIGALTFFPALGEAATPGLIAGLWGWRIKKWLGVEGWSISIIDPRGNVDVSFVNRFGREISTRISTREFLRLAEGEPQGIAGLGRMMDFWNGKVPILLSDIREAQAAPLWTTDAWADEIGPGWSRRDEKWEWDEAAMVARAARPEPTGAKIPKPLFGDTEDQLRHLGRTAITTPDRVGYVEMEETGDRFNPWSLKGRGGLAQLKPHTDPHNREMIEKTGDVFSFYTEAERVAYREEAERRIAEWREETRRRVRNQLAEK